ncbi:MAG: GatB/YqeY domain-containing protein [Flavobacteriaceae bacterium]
MSLRGTIETEYKKALKSKNKSKISTYRLILSSIKDLDIVNRSGPNKKETDDEDIKKLLKKNG